MSLQEVSSSSSIPADQADSLPFSLSHTVVSSLKGESPTLSGGRFQSQTISGFPLVHRLVVLLLRSSLVCLDRLERAALSVLCLRSKHSHQSRSVCVCETPKERENPFNPLIDGLEIHPFQSIRSNPPLSLILWLTITVDPFAFRSIKEEDVRKHTHKPPIEQSIEKRKGKRETLGMDLRIEIKIKTHTDRQRGARDRFVVGGVWEWKDFVQRVGVC